MVSVTFCDYMRIPSIQHWSRDESIYKSSVKQKAQNHSYITDDTLRSLSFLPLFGLGFAVSKSSFPPSNPTKVVIMNYHRKTPSLIQQYVKQ